MSVGAVKGIEFGAGFGAADLTGSVNNDNMRVASDGKVKFESNNAGGIIGGISNGNEDQDLYIDIFLILKRKSKGELL